MSGARVLSRKRRFVAPEVVQTSSMDCGPAALKCLLEGFHIPVSYGRLREACQTDVDGTSIDTIEVVANQLGIHAEQQMLPLDRLFLNSSNVLPALVVVRHTDGPTHFVVVWRRLGRWLQVMDPAVGRRWVRQDRFLGEVFRHSMSVPAPDWRDWAATDASVLPQRECMTRVGVTRARQDALISRALADTVWFTFGALDASVRLVTLLVQSGGVSAGREAGDLLEALVQDTVSQPDDIFKIIPKDYWSVSPDPDVYTRERQNLILSGAVVMHVSGALPKVPAGAADAAEDAAPLSPELVAALNEKPLNPLLTLWVLLKADGVLGPLALLGAVGIAAGATLIEALLFRGLFEVGGLLNLPSQRLMAAAGLLAFACLLLAFQIPILAESLRLGRRLDVRLRIALLRKLPHLTDRYFQSRPISDMADRSHSIHLTRLVPGIGIHFIQSFCEVIITLVGIVLIDPPSLVPAVALVMIAMVVPAVLQPMVNERDLRVRNQSGALNGFYLDTLLGLVPVRTHRAERAIRHQHEALLVEWARSSRRLIRTQMFADAVQSVGCVALAGYLLVEHFQRIGGVTGADLLLVYWTLKLPALGSTLTSLAHQYPMQRNILLRLLEPLSAPELTASRAPGHAIGLSQEFEEHAAETQSLPARRRPLSICIEGGHVLAAGRTILEGIDLKIGAGEHVAIVGLSGAGKSSLIGLLLGWHRLASGTLVLDGADMSSASLSHLRHEIAWLDPAVQIWNASLLDNLSYASPAADFGKTSTAIAQSHLRGVLTKLPQGLQTSLGEGGALMSGGEGQRVRLGRAFMQDGVRLALLDEPFRGMDRDQRTALLAEARRHWRDVTMLCVTHDVGETMSFDRVLVIEGGEIIEDGNPGALSATRSRYAELLSAERDVRADMWAGTQWRHMRVEGGQVTDAR